MADFLPAFDLNVRLEDASGERERLDPWRVSDATCEQRRAATMAFASGEQRGR
jgi:hypothetical protein